jgi:hypothetical protein
MRAIAVNACPATDRESSSYLFVHRWRCIDIWLRFSANIRRHVRTTYTSAGLLVVHCMARPHTNTQAPRSVPECLVNWDYDGVLNVALVSYSIVNMSLRVALYCSALIDIELTSRQVPGKSTHSNVDPAARAACLCVYVCVCVCVWSFGNRITTTQWEWLDQRKPQICVKEVGLIKI